VSLMIWTTMLLDSHVDMAHVINQHRSAWILLTCHTFSDIFCCYRCYTWPATSPRQQ
jgi:hypothetical protein